MKVLIADDEELARYTLRMLIGRNHRDLEIVAEAGDGEEAVALAKEHKPDLIILDIRMPLLDGLEAAEKIRRFDTSTTILMLTAYDDFSFAQQAIHAGVDGYLLKPVNPKDFANRLKAVKGKVGGKREKTVPPPSGTLKNSEKESNETEARKQAPVTTGSGFEHNVSWRLERALEYIRNNLSSDLPLDSVAEAAGISTQHLCRLFREELDTNFVKYLTERRIDQACRLLDTSTFGVAEIAGRCGFSDANYFARVFRKSRGISPLNYRNRAEHKAPPRY